MVKTEVVVSHGFLEHFRADKVAGSWSGLPRKPEAEQSIEISLQPAWICWLNKLCLFLVQNVQSAVENLHSFSYTLKYLRNGAWLFSWMIMPMYKTQNIFSEWNKVKFVKWQPFTQALLLEKKNNQNKLT